MTTERAYFNVLDAAEGRNPWSKTPPGATTAPKPYESDACWVSGHEDCADSLCLCQCHKTQTWDPWNEAWKPAEPAAVTGPGGQRPDLVHPLRRRRACRGLTRTGTAQHPTPPAEPAPDNRGDLVSTDLTHWHKIGDQPSILVPPIDCCKAAADKALWALEADLYRQREDAVRDERVRIVTEALEAIRAYSDAAQSVLDDPTARLMVDRATEKCAEAIRKVGCICPLIDVTSFGGERRTMPGYDSRCGMHDHTPLREPNAAPAQVQP